MIDSQFGTASMNGSGPSIFRFKARLGRHPEEAGRVALLGIPDAVNKKLPARDEMTVEGTINGHPFRGGLRPGPSGARSLRVNRAMLDGSGAGTGDVVDMVVLVPEAEPKVPADLKKAVFASSAARALWQAISPMNRHDWVRWVEAAKKPETRVRRVAIAVDKLNAGMRQPCCFNTYEYMLCRIGAEGPWKKASRRAAKDRPAR